MARGYGFNAQLASGVWGTIQIHIPIYAWIGINDFVRLQLLTLNVKWIKSRFGIIQNRAVVVSVE